MVLIESIAQPSSPHAPAEASLGLGARFALGSSQWRVDVAQALKDGRTTDRNTVRLHFQASIPFQ